jgi:hypothetical protein
MRIKKLWWPVVFMAETLTKKAKTGEFRIKESAKEAWRQLK